MASMTSFFKAHFPENKAKFKLYWKYSIPVIFASLLFSLNNFIDNFMVTHINGGIAALGIANTWTGFIFSAFLGVAYMSVTIFGQYYGKKDFANVKNVLKLRFIFNYIIVIPISIWVLISPDWFIRVFYRTNLQNGEEIIQKGISYICPLTLSWLLLATTFISGNTLREAGFGKYQMYSSVATLIVNIVFNAIFMYGLKMDVDGAAYATILARLSALISNFIIIQKTNKYLHIPLFSLFTNNMHVVKLFLRRFAAGFLVGGGIVLVTMRQVFWNIGYPQGTIGKPEYEIAAYSILGLTGSITGIFLGLFNVVETNVSIFVSRELGQGNLEKARANANELKGFHFTLTWISSFILVFLLIAIPYLNFFAKGVYDKVLENHGQAQAIEARDIFLKQLQLTMLPVLLFNPIWVWFVTSIRVLGSGKRSNFSGLLNFSGNFIQIIWLIVLVYIIIPKTNLELWQAYVIFFMSDITKVIFVETFYYKMNWAHDITKVEQKSTNP
ncbi:conserved hypothetical protein [Mycoplasmopsis pulmonis]|uniref:Probable multidrug resistance protein NorM n=1 Tax=Mycoplasmopsis pulmonis (strain UAB CTIP) TaxID=272635 RepID=Q98PI4_MYCPU|nr:MATE family efflux transporter [Mycoplasmopsis pulmonis]CAC13911.1 conserved hypothetical protein [Mycoplasmopsis pulmonis]